MTSLGFVGATGRLGQELAKGLITADGFDSFKAFVRPATAFGEKIEHLKELGFEIVPVDFDDSDALEEALAGVKTLVSTIGSKALWRVETSLVKAAKKAGVSLFVPSQFGVDGERFQSSFPFMKAKANVIETAEKEGLPVLRVCCGYFSDIIFDITGDPFNGETKLIGNPDEAAKISFTRRSDVGYVLAKALSDPEYSQGGTLMMEGDNMTWKDGLDLLVKQLSSVDFDIEKMTVDQAKEKMEAFLEKGENGDVWSGYKGFSLHLVIEPATGNQGVDMSANSKTYGHKMETLEETFKEIYHVSEDEE